MAIALPEYTATSSVMGQAKTVPRCRRAYDRLFGEDSEICRTSTAPRTVPPGRSVHEIPALTVVWDSTAGDSGAEDHCVTASIIGVKHQRAVWFRSR